MEQTSLLSEVSCKEISKEPWITVDKIIQAVSINKQTHEALCALASVPSAREACGFLLGTLSERGVIGTRAIPVFNAAAHAGRFAIADHERRRVEIIARRLDLEVVSVYHSHPYGDGQPSELDRQCLRFSKLPWIIIYRPPPTADMTRSLAAYAPRSGTPIPVEII
jgi:proteasome lid subunit RPN8/RPN11